MATRVPDPQRRRARRGVPRLLGAAAMRTLLALSCVMPGCNPPSPAPTGAAGDAAATASAADAASDAAPVEAAASTTGPAADDAATEPGGSSANPAKAAKVKATASKAGSSPEESASSEVPSPVSKKPGPTKVAKIVFVGKENACECTRKRVDAGWDALQKALGTPPKLPVVKLQIDTQSSSVDPYKEQQAMVALPAIYFVDAQGLVLELLQGDITKAQVADTLKKL